jgi:hypothetical protein
MVAVTDTLMIFLDSLVSPRMVRFRHRIARSDTFWLDGLDAEYGGPRRDATNMISRS